MSAALETQVLIVGGGPTGLVAALALSKLGISCVLVEPLTHAARHPKAHELSPRSIEILESLGVPFAQMDAEASPYDDSARVLFCGRLDEELGRIDLNAGGADAKYFREVRAPKPFLNLSQAALEETLRAQVATRPHVTLRYGYVWKGFPDGVEGASVRSLLEPAPGAPGEPIALRSRYVLCADGAGSRCRRALGVRMEGPDTLQDFVNAYFEEDLTAVVPTRAKLYFSLDPACAGTFVAHHVEKRWVYHVPYFPPYERAEDFTREVLSARIEAALGRRLEGLKIVSIETWRMTAQLAERFSVGRAFLVGDAAHRFPPTGGLGMNSGIADAHNLCWKLALVLRGAARPALLDTYALERRPVVDRNRKESVENFFNLFTLLAEVGLPFDGLKRAAATRASLRKWLPAGVVEGLMGLVARVVRGRIRRARKDPARLARIQASVDAQIGHFDRLGLDLGARYEEGALVPDGSLAPENAHEVTDYVPSSRPGSRLRHVWLDAQQSRSSHDLLDPTRFTLLTGAEGGRWSQALPESLRHSGLVSVAALESVDTAAHFELEPSGALLVRPDGYVAWRAKAWVDDAPAVLGRVFHDALGFLPEAAP